jgi:hypothetical protein
MRWGLEVSQRIAVISIVGSAAQMSIFLLPSVVAALKQWRNISTHCALVGSRPIVPAMSSMDISFGSAIESVRLVVLGVRQRKRRKFVMEEDRVCAGEKGID